MKNKEVVSSLDQVKNVLIQCAERSGPLGNGRWYPEAGAHPDPGRNCDLEGGMNGGLQILSLVAACQFQLWSE